MPPAWVAITVITSFLGWMPIFENFKSSGKTFPLNINWIAKIGLSLYSLCTDFLISAIALFGSGYSFRDRHINVSLIIPRLRKNDIKLFALFKEEPDHINEFKQNRGFNYITEKKGYINRKEFIEPSNLWKFSNFINELASFAGVDWN